MIPLASTQESFQRYVLDGDAAIAAAIAGPDDAFRAVRLGIYRDAYRLRLSEVLGNDFEALKAFVGVEAFDDLARAYVEANPSTFRNVRWFGGRFAHFLRDHEASRGRPVLAELAGFEWALGLAFDAADEAALDFRSLAAVPGVDWPDLAFTGHPSLHVLRLNWNVAEIWRAAQDRAPLPRASALESPATTVIWRRELRTYFRPLAEDEARMLEAVMRGATFSEVCAILAAHDEAGAAQRAAELLRNWVNEGWLGSYKVIRGPGD